MKQMLMEGPRLGLRGKLLLFSLPLVNLAFVAMWLLVTQTARVGLTELSQSNLGQGAQSLAGALQQTVDDSWSDAVTTARLDLANEALDSADPKNFEAYANELVRTKGKYAAMFVSDDLGEIVAANSLSRSGKPVPASLMGKHIEAEPWFAAAFAAPAGQTIIVNRSRPEFLRPNLSEDEFVAGFSLPIFNVLDEPVGTLTVLVSLVALGEQLQNFVVEKDGKVDSLAVVVDDTGAVAMLPPTFQGSPAWRSASITQAEQPWAAPNEMQYQLLSSPVKGRAAPWGWKVYALKTVETLLAPVKSISARLLWAFGLAILLTTSVLAVMISRFLKPIRKLTEATASTDRAADFTPIQVTSSDEAGTLTIAFNRMLSSLKEYQTGLEQKVEDRTRALQVAQNERDTFFRMSPDMLCVVGPKLEFLQTNPSWTRQLGYAEDALKGRSLLDLVHPEDRDPTLAAVSSISAAGAVMGFQNRCRSHDGLWRDLSWTATADPAGGHFFATARDVTEQRARERDQSQAQKLEAVGQLASGMAHEINTPVQFIGDNVQFVADSFGELTEYLQATQALQGPEFAALAALGEKVDLEYLIKEVPRSLLEAKDGVRRVAELVRALKEYAHPDTPEMAPADINEALRRTLVLARNELKYVAAVETDLGTLPPVACHIGSLQQVFLNLLVNAAHAIEDKKKNEPSGAQLGGIHVSTRAEKDDVVISIRDSGCGISAAVRERMFEPFFTTKAVGRGSGQGLPLVHAVIVDKHHGHIDIDSEVGVGTTFILRLPCNPRGTA